MTASNSGRRLGMKTASQDDYSQVRPWGDDSLSTDDGSGELDGEARSDEDGGSADDTEYSDNDSYSGDGTDYDEATDYAHWHDTPAPAREDAPAPTPAELEPEVVLIDFIDLGLSSEWATGCFLDFGDDGVAIAEYPADAPGKDGTIAESGNSTIMDILPGGCYWPDSNSYAPLKEFVGIDLSRLDIGNFIPPCIPGSPSIEAANDEAAKPVQELVGISLANTAYDFIV